MIQLQAVLLTWVSLLNREQCEELRSTMSKRQQDEVAAERIDQLRIKAHMEEDQRAEDQMYADLWHADMMAKAQREEAETKRQMSANMETLSVLNKQMAALEAKKEEERRLKEEEAALLVGHLFFLSQEYGMTVDWAVCCHSVPVFHVFCVFFCRKCLPFETHKVTWFI